MGDKPLVPSGTGIEVAAPRPGVGRAFGEGGRP